MKPTGSTAAKKSRSEAVRRSPEQPRITANGALSGNYAPDVAPLQLTADAIRIGERGRLETVIHPLFAEIGTDGCRRETPEQVCIGALEAVPFLTRVALAAHRCELKPSAARLLHCSWFCRSDFGLGGRFAGGLLWLGLCRRI